MTPGYDYVPYSPSTATPTASGQQRTGFGPSVRAAGYIPTSIRNASAVQAASPARTTPVASGCALKLALRQWLHLWRSSTSMSMSIIMRNAI